jgi:hypothetical protein
MAQSTLRADHPSVSVSANASQVGFRPVVFLALLAAGYAGANAWVHQQGRAYPIDPDGWGHLVAIQQANGRSLATLFTEPSLWKGPIVPFVYGLTYFITPYGQAVLAFNAAAFGLAAAGFYVGFCRLGANRSVAVLAILAWVFYLPLRHVFGYYFAEPFLALVVAATFLAAGEAVLRRSSVFALVTGALGGLLLLSRAPFLLAVCGLPILLAYHLPERRARIVAAFAAGFLLTFAPWGIRNWVVHREVIPFTLEGGKILFQGVYLAGDDAPMGSYLPELQSSMEGTLRQMPEFVELEKGEMGKSPIEQYRYWRSLAREQALSDIPGQLRLCVRKAIRFWAYLPQHSWLPAWKTGLVALVCLPLASYGAYRGRRSLLVQQCVLWVGGLWAFHALVHAELRYNFPILPMAFLLAVLGVRHLLTSVAKTP